MDSARNHLLSIPTYESHYSRKKSQRKYLPSHVTLRALYEEYLNAVPGQHVSRRIYENIFHDLKLTIKKPKEDTCQTCDRLQLKIENSEGDDKIERKKCTKKRQT